MTSLDFVNAAKAYRKLNRDAMKGDSSEWARAMRRADDNFVSFIKRLHEGHTIEEAWESCR